MPARSEPMAHGEAGRVATPLEPDGPKRNRGNRRTGYSKNRHTAPGLHPGQLPWDKDREILERLAQVQQMLAAGHTSKEIGARLGLHEDTIDDDRRRLRILAERAPIGALVESVDKLRFLYRQALGAFAATASSSLNRSAYLSVARQAVMDEAKLLGQEPKQRVEMEATLHNGDRDLDADIEEYLAQRGARVARPRLVGEGEGAVEAESPA